MIVAGKARNCGEHRKTKSTKSPQKTVEAILPTASRLVVNCHPHRPCPRARSPQTLTSPLNLLLSRVECQRLSGMRPPSNGREKFMLRVLLRGENQEVIRSILREVILLHQLMTSLICLPNHNLRGHAVILAIAVTVNHSHFCLRNGRWTHVTQCSAIRLLVVG